MIIELLYSACCLEKDISTESIKYFSLPITVNGYHILQREFSTRFQRYIFSIGVFKNGQYTPKFWLHTDEHGEKDCIVFDSDKLKDLNWWLSR